MAAKKGNKNALGNSGGKSLNDRQKAADVRSLALSEIYTVLQTGQTVGNKDLYRAVLIRLAGAVLPRLNEHTGEDGERLFPDGLFADYTKPNGKQNRENNSHREDTSDDEEDQNLSGGD